MFGEVEYCIFKREVLQFWNDDIGDFWGYTSLLAEDIARDILHVQIGFCTEVDQ
jgi:hypothetical protein